MDARLKDIDREISGLPIEAAQTRMKPEDVQARLNQLNRQRESIRNRLNQLGGMTDASTGGGNVLRYDTLGNPVR